MWSRGTASQQHRPSLLACLRRFRDDEGGALIIFALVIFVLMLMVSGIAVDMMRHEAMRTRLQNTLDSATLAAANLDQTLDPQSVVEDYFAKAGLSQYLSGVTVTSGLNARTVTATASATLPSLFMQLAGVNSLTVPAASTAKEAIGNVEISLVLDVSGSMGQNSKIDNLKVAAKQFIDTMFANVDAGKLSISIIPYAAQVTAGPTLFSYYNSTKDHSYSYCIDFDSADFSSAALSTTQSLQQAGNFDPWYRTTSIDRYGMRVCPKETSRYIVPFSDDATALKAAIDALQPGGNTSIDVGMKWGAALLDPSSQPIVTDLIDKGTLPAAFAGRPYDYSNRQSMKVVVVMTDGENTNRAVLQPPYTSGTSIVWQNTKDGTFSIYDASRNQYWSQYKKEWRDEAWGNQGAIQSCYTDWKGRTKCTTISSADTGYPNGAVQMTWPEVWEAMSIDWFDYYLIYPAYGYSAYYSWEAKLVNWLDPYTTMDTQLHNICAATKANNVTIYSIGFETNSHGESVLKDCATSAGYFYSVKGLDITTAFASIANSINKLRLTQ